MHQIITLYSHLETQQLETLKLKTLWTFLMLFLFETSEKWATRIWYNNISNNNNKWKEKRVWERERRKNGHNCSGHWATLTIIIMKPILVRFCIIFRDVLSNLLWLWVFNICSHCILPICAYCVRANFQLVGGTLKMVILCLGAAKNRCSLSFQNGHTHTHKRWQFTKIEKKNSRVLPLTKLVYLIQVLIVFQVYIDKICGKLNVS